VPGLRPNTAITPGLQLEAAQGCLLGLAPDVQARNHPDLDLGGRFQRMCPRQVLPGAAATLMRVSRLLLGGMRALDGDRKACASANGAALQEGGDIRGWHGSREVEALAGVGAERGQLVVLVDRFNALGYDGHS
jgi:hypothetical protein